MTIHRYLFFAVLAVFIVILTGCPGIGKVDQQAADSAIKIIKETYGEKVKDIKIYRDKLEIAFDKGMSNPEKAQIFQDAARYWWVGYPDNRKPKHKLYCFAYDDVISGDDDDKIGSLQITIGLGGKPKVLGEPGIYALRDVK